MRNHLFAWKWWSPAWMLCSSDDDDDSGGGGGGGDSGGGGGDDDSGSGASGGGGGGDDDSGSGASGGAGAGDDDSGSGAKSGGAGDDDSGSGAGAGAGSGAGDDDSGSGAKSGGAGDDDAGAGTAAAHEGSGDTSGAGTGASAHEGSGDTSGESPGGVSADAAGALDGAGPGIGAAAPGAAAGAVGGFSSAEDVLAGLDSPVSQALAAPAFGGPNESIMPLGGPNSYDPSLTQGSPVGAPVAKDESRFGAPAAAATPGVGPGNMAPGDAVANLNSPFGAGPGPGLNVQDATGLAWTQSVSNTDPNGVPLGSFDGGQPAAPPGDTFAGAPVGGLNSPFGAGPGAAPAGSFQGQIASNPGMPDAMAQTPVAGAAPTGDQIVGVPGNPSANQVVAAGDQSGMFSPTMAGTPAAAPGINPDQVALGLNPTGDLQGGLPLGATSGAPSVAGGPPSGTAPSASPAGPGAVASTGPSASPGAPQGGQGPGPASSTVTDTAAASPGPGTSTSADVAAALAGADGGGGGTSGGGGGGSGGGTTLAQQITAPIPGSGTPSPPIPLSPDGGNYNPEGGIYGKPGDNSIGGVPAPSLGPMGAASMALVDGALTVGNTDPNAGGPEGNYNAESGVYDALNNA